MFQSGIYSAHRDELKKKMHSGIALFLGNTESPMNYPSNAFRFRQDSDFLYFFGLDFPGLAGVIDFDSGDVMLFGDDFTMDDILWMGPQKSISELAALSAIQKTGQLRDFDTVIDEALKKNRKIHFLPPYRGETKMALGRLLKEDPCQMRSQSSEELIRAVVSLRSVKSAEEITELEKAIEIAYEMHVTAMKMSRPGMKEQEIYGTIEGIALSRGAGVSFPVILSMNGQTLHNHDHSGILEAGRMLLVDAGAESNMHYASDITRTTPVGGKFGPLQREIYEIVLKANTEAINAAKPGISNRDVHFIAVKVIAMGLKELGLMKGNTEDAVSQGAHALFMPHGIGHMLGLDVHDMEALGENFVGYNDEVRRSDQFGTAFLRFALPYKPGHVFTIEPGCYFIPELIGKWRSEKKFTSFIDYDKLQKYMSVGGIRIEDNVLITADGHKVLGKPIPKTIAEVEQICEAV